jgi:hypothetical protein
MAAAHATLAMPRGPVGLYLGVFLGLGRIVTLEKQLLDMIGNLV